jgi:hypothetical protein
MGDHHSMLFILEMVRAFVDACVGTLIIIAFYGWLIPFLVTLIV